MDKLDGFARPYRIDDAANWRLASVDPDDTAGMDKKDGSPQLLARDIERLAALQEKLYAQDRWALLLIFQAMDAAGKDSTIKHVMTGINPQGCQVHSFKAPSPEDLDHDFLWRSMCRLPARGEIGIFNRSYYEETLVVCVHPEILAREKLPRELVTADIWKLRFEDINAFERYLARNGVAVVKFFLHLSKKEQKKRFISRLDDREKNWKFSGDDVRERERWDDYMAAYEETIRATATAHAPWYVVPADHKWFTHLAVAATIVDTLARIDPRPPKTSAAEKRELARYRSQLERGG